MRLLYRLTRSAHIHGDVADRFKRHLPTGRLLDLPAGDGVNTRGLVAGGYEVVAGDLFPDECAGEDYEVKKVNLLDRPLPFEDESFDGILHSEGIEHLDAQVGVLRELARILKPGGVLIVTMPNVLNLQQRVAHVLTGHAHPYRALVVSTAAYWGDQGRPPHETPDDQIYFGHVFLINAFQLRFYLEHVGLEVVEVDTARYSINALLWAPFLYLWVWLATWRALRGRRSKLPKAKQREIRKQMLSGAVLFGRKLIMVGRKPAE